MRDDTATSKGKYPYSDAPDITDLGNGVFQIDTRMAGYQGITAGYLIRSSRPCLVETGTASSAPVMRKALAALGVGGTDLATVVVTHIHLDHAGGVGDVAAMYPAAEVVVHAKGARHLADPSRLMASARQVYGNALDVLFGTLAPVPADRIRSLDDVGTVDLGDGRRLDSHYSPGHAKHHVGLIDSASGDLYVGDAAGVYIPDTGDLRPATPPPDFDLEVALASLRRFSALRPTRLLFSHYGPVDDVSAILERSAEEITVWVEGTRAARAAGLDLDHAIAMVREQTLSRYLALGPDADPAVAEKFERISSGAANVSGIWHWLDKVGMPDLYAVPRPPTTARSLAVGVTRRKIFRVGETVAWLSGGRAVIRDSRRSMVRCPARAITPAGPGVIAPPTRRGVLVPSREPRPAACVPRAPPARVISGRPARYEPVFD